MSLVDPAFNPMDIVTEFNPMNIVTELEPNSDRSLIEKCFRERRKIDCKFCYAEVGFHLSFIPTGDFLSEGEVETVEHLPRFMEINYGKDENTTAFRLSKDHIYTCLAVAAYYMDDDKFGAWYRGIITKIVDDQFVEVYFVDYGNCETIEISMLCALYKDVANWPVQVICCSIEGLDNGIASSGDRKVQKAVVDCVWNTLEEHLDNFKCKIQFTSDSPSTFYSCNVFKWPIRIYSIAEVPITHYLIQEINLLCDKSHCPPPRRVRIRDHTASLPHTSHIPSTRDYAPSTSRDDAPSASQIPSPSQPAPAPSVLQTKHVGGARPKIKTTDPTVLLIPSRVAEGNPETVDLADPSPVLPQFTSSPFMTPQRTPNSSPVRFETLGIVLEVWNGIGGGRMGRLRCPSSFGHRPVIFTEKTLFKEDGAPSLNSSHKWPYIGNLFKVVVIDNGGGVLYVEEMSLMITKTINPAPEPVHALLLCVDRKCEYALAYTIDYQLTIIPAEACVSFEQAHKNASLLKYPPSHHTFESSANVFPWIIPGRSVVLMNVPCPQFMRNVGENVQITFMAVSAQPYVRPDDTVPDQDMNAVVYKHLPIEKGTVVYCAYADKTITAFLPYIVAAGCLGATRNEIVEHLPEGRSLNVRLCPELPERPYKWMVYAVADKNSPARTQNELNLRRELCLEGDEKNLVVDVLGDKSFTRNNEASTSHISHIFHAESIAQSLIPPQSLIHPQPPSSQSLIPPQPPSQSLILPQSLIHPQPPSSQSLIPPQSLIHPQPPSSQSLIPPQFLIPPQPPSQSLIPPKPLSQSFIPPQPLSQSPPVLLPLPVRSKPMNAGAFSTPVNSRNLSIPLARNRSAFQPLTQNSIPSSSRTHTSSPSDLDVSLIDFRDASTTPKGKVRPTFGTPVLSSRK